MTRLPAQPQVTLDEVFDDSVQFVCKFTPVADATANYQVIWYLGDTEFSTATIDSVETGATTVSVTEAFSDEDDIALGVSRCTFFQIDVYFHNILSSYSLNGDCLSIKKNKFSDAS